MEVETNSNFIPICNFIKKNGEHCKKRPNNNTGYCNVHSTNKQHDISRLTDDDTISQSSIKSSVKSSVKSFKSHHSNKLEPKNYDVSDDETKMFNYIDRYFQKHYIRCRALEQMKGEPKSKSSFDLTTLLTIGGMSLAPMLLSKFNNKNLCNNNIDNASSYKRENRVDEKCQTDDRKNTTQAGESESK